MIAEFGVRRAGFDQGNPHLLVGQFLAGRFEGGAAPHLVALWTPLPLRTVRPATELIFTTSATPRGES